MSSASAHLSSEHRWRQTRASCLLRLMPPCAVRQKNSIQKMLCHQLAAAHVSGMNLIAGLDTSRGLPHVDAARLTNAAARLFEVYQAGCLTPQKLKSGGRLPNRNDW